MPLIFKNSKLNWGDGECRGREQDESHQWLKRWDIWNEGIGYRAMLSGNIWLSTLWIQ